VIDIKISLAFGAALMIVGGALFRSHFTAWDEHRHDETLEDRERNYYRSQFRRRVQVAVLIVLLGILIPLADFLIFMKSPRLFTVLVLGILLVAGWIMVLAALDWLSQRVFNRSLESRIANVARRRRELEDEVERLRNRDSDDEG
jgi:hypothetical protein